MHISCTSNPLVNFVFFLVLIAAANDDAAKEVLECWTDGINQAKARFGDVGDIISAAATEGLIASMPQQMMQAQLAAQITGYPSEHFKVIDARDEVGPDGKTIKKNIYSFPRRFDPKSWGDRTKLEPRVRSICKSLYSNLTDFCVEAFFKKQQNLDALYVKYEGKIREASQALLRNPNTKYSELFPAGSIEVDDVTKTHLSYSTKAFKDFTLDPAINAGDIVFNDQKQSVGLRLSVNRNGRDEIFLVPRVGAGKYVNPLFFVFNGASAEEWNAHWQKELGTFQIK